MNFRNLADRINNSLIDDDFRQAFSLILLSFLLSVICIVACIPHFVDDSEKVMAFVLVGISIFSAAVFSQFHIKDWDR